jgi:fluoride exporter
VEPWIRVAVLSVGGALGVNARYWLGAWITRWASPRFPWATFTINVSGSFAIGFLAMVLHRWLPHPHVRLLVLVGFLGGYTTFSAFSYDSLTLLERGEKGLSLANMAGSVAAGLAAVALGVGLARASTLGPSERRVRDVPPVRVRVEMRGPSPPTADPDRGRESGSGRALPADEGRAAVDAERRAREGLP